MLLETDLPGHGMAFARMVSDEQPLPRVAYYQNKKQENDPL